MYSFSGVFASMAPVAGAPMLGFGDLPSIPTSLIDFHGINDDTIPYDLEHSEGEHCDQKNQSDEIINSFSLSWW